jgi:DNA-binding transcriptional LysR family regulator
MLKLEALRVFVTVAECGNIKDAAEQLGRTPSAISMTLKQVEDQLGAPIFESDRKHSLTDLGRFTLNVAAVLLRDYDRAIDLIEAYAHNRAGRLRLASVPSVAVMLIPQLLRDFVAARPGVEIDLVDTDSAGVRMLVETGQADLGIASAPPDSIGLGFEPLFRDPFRLICRIGSPLVASPAPLSWDALEGYEMIVNEASRSLPSPGFRALARHARLTVRNVASLLAMVQSGIGVTLLPALATVNLPVSLCSVPLADPAALRIVGLISRQGKIASPVTAAFREIFAAAVRRRAKHLGLSLPHQAAGASSNLLSPRCSKRPDS